MSSICTEMVPLASRSSCTTHRVRVHLAQARQTLWAEGLQRVQRCVQAGLICATEAHSSRQQTYLLHARVQHAQQSVLAGGREVAALRAVQHSGSGIFPQQTAAVRASCALTSTVCG